MRGNGGEKDKCLLFSEAVARAEGEGVQRSAVVVFVALVAEPSLRGEALWVGPVARGVVGGVLGHIDRGLMGVGQS